MSETVNLPSLPPAERAVARAEMDVAIARRTAVLNQITADTIVLRGRLEQAGWKIRDSDLEMTAPDGKAKAQVTYCGGEFLVTLSHLPGVGRTVLRITPTLYERQPSCVDALTEILVDLGRGHDVTLHLDEAKVPLGLVGPSGVLFGERIGDDGDLDEEIDLAERARDEGPPDMSGSTPGVER